MNRNQCCETLFSVEDCHENLCADAQSGHSHFYVDCLPICRADAPKVENLKCEQGTGRKSSGNLGLIRPRFKVTPNFVVYGRRRPNPIGVYCKERRQRVSKCQSADVKTKPVIENPIGFAFASLRIDDFLNQERENSLLLQGFATCLVAFGEIYLTPEAEWCHNTLNCLLQEGANHVENSLKNYEGDSREVNVISKCFTLRRNGMEVFVSDPILVGMIECTSPRVYSFGVAITMFMRKFQYCLLRVEDRFYLIWKKQHAYFLFDCYGRSMNGQSDLENGEAALICVGSTKKIGILITYLGQVSPDSIYTLYQLKMLRLMQCCDGPFICSGQPRKNEYEVISDHHARLQGTYHLGTDCFKANRYKQALAIGLVAVIYSKIDAPCTWDTKIVNKVLMLGNRCYSQWTHHNPEKCLYLEHIPAQFPVGQYLAEIVIFPAVSCGSWVNLPDHEFCEITRAIKNAFQELKSLNILVQVDHKMYSIWKRNGLFYLFDPYPMEFMQAQVKSDGRTNATLHMFSTVKLLCCVLTQQIIGLSIPCKFILHRVKVLKLTMVSSQTITNDWPVSCVDPQSKMNDKEAASLNESVYDICCEKELSCSQQQYDIDHCDLDVPRLPPIPTQNLQPAQIFQETAPSEGELKDYDEEGENEEEEVAEEEESEEESEEKKKIGKKPGRPKALKKSKKSGKGKNRDDSGSSDESEVNLNGKGKDKDKGKGKSVDGSSIDERKGGKGKDKEGKGKTTDDETSEEGGKGKKREKQKPKIDKEREKKDKKRVTKDNEKGKKDKEKEKKEKEKEEKKRKEEEKKTGVDNGKGKASGKESSSNGKNDKEKDKDKNKGKYENKKDKKKGKPEAGGMSSGEITSSASEGSTPSKPSKSSVLSASETYTKKESKLIQRYGKDGVCLTGMEPIGGWPKGSGCMPNSYPGYTHVARNLAVVGSETGSYQSICQLIRSAFQVADRILTMTAWGNYVVFKNMASYLLYDGCTCNPCRFRNIDLSVGTAGLLCFDNLHDLIIEVLKGKSRSIAEQAKPLTIDDICNEYC